MKDEQPWLLMGPATISALSFPVMRLPWIVLVHEPKDKMPKMTFGPLSEVS